MRKSAAGGVLFPDVALSINFSPDFPSQFLCSGRGLVQLTTTLAPYTLTCKTAQAIRTLSTDRLTLWTGFYVATGPGKKGVSAEFAMEGTANGNYDSRFVMTVPANPRITNISPQLGAEGTVVTISGANFGTVSSAGTVSLGRQTVTPSSWTNTSIQFTVPDGVVRGPVNVSINGLDSNTWMFIGSWDDTRCQPTVSARTMTFNQAGQALTLNVTAAATCEWTISAPASWISQSTYEGVGNGSVTLTASANNSTTARTASATVNGLPIGLLQKGTIGAPSYISKTLAPPTVGTDVNGNISCQLTVSRPNETGSPLFVGMDLYAEDGFRLSGSFAVGHSFNLWLTHTPDNANTYCLTFDAVSGFVTSESAPEGDLVSLLVDGAGPPSVQVTRPGATVGVHVSNGPADRLDWVGIYRVGTDNVTGRLTWAYLNGLLTPPATGLPTATMNFVLPADNGQYEFRFFTAGGYERRGTSTKLVVTCVTAVSHLAVLAEFGTDSVPIDVSAPPDCDWSADTGDSFLSILSGSPGTGSGAVVVGLETNPSPEARAGTVRIGGIDVAVTQDGDLADPEQCAVLLSAHSDTGATGAFELNGPANCPWTAQSLSPDVSLSQSSGMGPGSVPYSLSAAWAPSTASALEIGALPTSFTPTSSGRICISIPIVRIDRTDFPVQFVQLCVYPPSQGGVGGNEPALPPALITTHSAALRGTTVGLRVINATGARISNWRYEAAGFPEFIRTTDRSAATWLGRLVVGGTVKVTVVKGGQTYPLSLGVTIAPRDNFRTTAAAATPVEQGYLCNNIPQFLPVPIVPGDGVMGRNCLSQNISVTTSALIPGGPNEGARYVETITDTSTYQWIVNPDLKDSTCQFYTQQLGTYSAANPSGLISGEHLLTNVDRHEHGPTQSHYSQYVAAVSQPGLNVGTEVESMVSGRGEASTFTSKVGNTLTTIRDEVYRLWGQEPLGPNYTENNEFQGAINYTPYTACHP
jgi:hypothetical protein